MIDTYHKIYHFLSWKREILFLSVFLFFVSFIIMAIRGFNWGIDFTGGVLVEIALEEDMDPVNIQNILINAGYKKVVIQYFSASKNVIIRLPSDMNGNKINQNISNTVLDVLQQNIVQKFFVKQVNCIGPSVSNQLINTGMIALLIALMCMLVYVTFRFEWRLATGIVVSLTHDVITILGMLSLFSIEINATIIAALMSAISYSINDKIVIFDRIRENFCRMSAIKSVDIFNISLSQVLSRTIITSVTTIMVLLILLIFGGTMLQGFAITLLFGSFFGTMSSIYIASSLALKLGTARVHFVKNK